MPTHNAERGFTLIELIVVVCLVAVFVAIGLDRLRLYQEAAENVAMEATLAAMRGGLQMRAAQLLIKGDAEGIAALANGNPVQLLSESPPGYAGELRGSEANLPGGSWYFDSLRREIVYIPALTAHLRVGGKAGEGARLRFRTDVHIGLPPIETIAGFRGAKVVSVQPYTWFKGLDDVPMPEFPSGTTGVRPLTSE